MVKKRFLLGVLVMNLLPTACAPLTFEEYPTPPTISFYDEPIETPSGTQQVRRDQGDNPLSKEIILLVGTLRLRGTDYEVTSDQAKDLYSLWTRMKGLTASLTSTPNDIDEVTNQIQTNMMPEQMWSIDDMNLTFQDMVNLMDELGISFRFRGHWKTPEATSEGEQGLVQLEDASTSNSSVTSNSPGEDDGERRPHMIPTGLLDVLISYLQERR